MVSFAKILESTISQNLTGATTASGCAEEDKIFQKLSMLLQNFKADDTIGLLKTLSHVGNAGLKAHILSRICREIASVHEEVKDAIALNTEADNYLNESKNSMDFSEERQIIANQRC